MTTQFNLADDTDRLVLADWLEEQGREGEATLARRTAWLGWDGDRLRERRCRLSSREEEEARRAFAEWRHEEMDGNGGINGYLSHFDGCEVQYRDDYDTCQAYWQVVDADGRGDGTGEWHRVEGWA